MAQAMLITGTDRRRRWSEEEKVAILVEAFAPGASPIDVARRWEVSTGLLYTWRKKAAAPDSEPVFLPAVVAEPEAPRAVSEPPARACDKPPPIIEIQLKRGVKVRIEAGMPEALITATLKALR